MNVHEMIDYVCDVTNEIMGEPMTLEDGARTASQLNLLAAQGQESPEGPLRDQAPYVFDGSHLFSRTAYGQFLAHEGEEDAFWVYHATLTPEQGDGLVWAVIAWLDWPNPSATGFLVRLRERRAAREAAGVPQRYSDGAWVDRDP